MTNAVRGSRVSEQRQAELFAADNVMEPFPEEAANILPPRERWWVLRGEGRKEGANGINTEAEVARLVGGGEVSVRLGARVGS